MAARKSCTHITWNEAKGKQRKGGPTRNIGKGKMSHKELVAKWALQGGKFANKSKVWTKAEIEARRDKALSTKSGEPDCDSSQEEKDNQEATEATATTPAELARRRMMRLAERLRNQGPRGEPGDSVGSNVRSSVGSSGVRECSLDWEAVEAAARSQVDELHALEAMFPGEFFLCSARGELERVATALETGEIDRSALASHVPFEFLLALTLPDRRAAQVAELSLIHI